MGNTCIISSESRVDCEPILHWRHYMKDFIARPNIKSIKFKEDLENRFFCNVSMGQCHKSRKTLKGGKISDQYVRLWDYANNIRRSNFDSSI